MAEPREARRDYHRPCGELDVLSDHAGRDQYGTTAVFKAPSGPHELSLVRAWVKEMVRKRTDRSKAELRSNLEAALELLTRLLRGVKRFFEELDRKYIFA